MTRRIVGLVGLARSGKDSVGTLLLNTQGFQMTSAFANPLKWGAMETFGLTFQEAFGMGVDREEIHPFWGISIREILQKFGTESIRNVFGEDHWVRLMEKKLQESTVDTVLTDVRFDNEIEMIRRFGGKIIGIVRTEDQPTVQYHVSEEMATFRLEEVSDDIIYAANLDELREGVERIWKKAGV